MVNFDRFCIRMFPDERVLTQDLVFAWCNDARGSGRCGRATAMRGFGRYLVLVEDEDAYIVPALFFTRKKSRLPHIMSEDELQRFFEATDQFSSLHDPLLEYTVPVIFRLIFALGLRPMEARELRRVDFDLKNDIVHVVNSKNGKDRRLPVDAEITDMCHKYDQIAEMQIPDRVYFFQSPKTGKAYSDRWLLDKFHKAWEMGGNDKPFARCTPYTLRHNYVTHTMQRWFEEGRNIEALIPQLTQYLGHSEFKHTLYYLQLLPERLTNMDAFRTNNIIPEVNYEIQ